jgi:hypothetical protein
MRNSFLDDGESCAFEARTWVLFVPLSNAFVLFLCLPSAAPQEGSCGAD